MADGALQGQSKREAYFPKGIWYNLFDNSSIDAHDGGKTVTLDLPMGHVGVHAPGGTILPLQQPALVTAEVRASALTLLVGLPHLQPLPRLATSSMLHMPKQGTEQYDTAKSADINHHRHKDAAQWKPHRQQQQQQIQQPRQPSAENQQGPAITQRRSMLTQQAVEKQAEGVCGVSEPGRATACGSIYMDSGDQLQVCCPFSASLALPHPFMIALFSCHNRRFVP